MSNSVISDHPYSARSQSQVVRPFPKSSKSDTSNKENAKPSTSRKSTNAPVKKAFVFESSRASTSKKPILAEQIVKRTVNNQKADHYEQQAYQNKSN